MLRVAILENEEVTKNILFTLGSVFEDEDWTFRYFTKLSQLVKAQQEKEYHLIIMQEKFDTERIANTFILPYPERVIVFTSNQAKAPNDAFHRVLYVDKKNLKEELQGLKAIMKDCLLMDDEYLFSYNHVNVPLKIRDIYYIEKDNKNLIYHTKRGKFSERKNIKDAEKVFEKYHFLRIHSSFLVNYQYITKIETDTVYLHDLGLPFARLRRQEVIDKIRKYTKTEI